MTRRMKKRSRQTSRSGTESTEDSGAANRSKADMQRGKRARVEVKLTEGKLPSSGSLSPTGPALEDLPISLYPQPHDTEMLFFTPRPKTSSNHATSPGSVTHIAPPGDDLSPIPAARRFLSRTSSRNLKENSNRLASPFTSHPSSRAGSPTKSKPKKKIQRSTFHTKSRTLSVALDPTALNQNVNFNQSSSAGILAQAQAKKAQSSKSDTMTHTRTGSIPIIPSLQDLSSDPWLVNPGSFTRYREELDSDIEHPSFFFDVPLGISTPPRKRRATTGVLRMRPDSSDLELSEHSPCWRGNDGEGLSRSPSPSAGSSGGHFQARRRRRTITHPAEADGFSRVLDFTSSIKDLRRTSSISCLNDVDASDQTTKPITQLSQASPLSTAFSKINLGLASAFSLSGIQSSLSPLSGLARSASAPTLEPAPLAANEGIRSALPSSGSSLTGHRDYESDDDELKGLFSELELNEGAKWDIATVRRMRDSDIAVPPVTPSERSVSQESSSLITSKPIESQKPIHRRKRGDTIRASDFARPPPVLDPSVNVTGTALADSNADGGTNSRARRTRSGTVTLANPAASSTVRPSSGNDAQRKATSPMRMHRRTQEGRFRVKRGIDDEPLRANSDDEDDELLLKARRSKKL
ncbi:hypothetical protein WOLCODRAFT_165139 [Wolfiporia cocos MD-104 SS10]|uniref:Uncharacterized protein n=1 Tax=Wolfiporia cocos (strain MD-104) TaxID=742152 RepID=A0A2H3K7L7_WOLCO|nr:hypothetical protein WOLCODRAFT_165139 [Wolfiporia cocos MD-104 SS10]